MLPMKTNTQRTMVFLLLGMGLVTVALICAAIYLFSSGMDRPFAKKNGALRTYIQVPTKAEVGEPTSLIVTVRNDSTNYLSLDEIRLPETLLNTADIASIVPGTLNHQEYEGERGYQIGFLMAPGDQRQFEITLIPRQADDFVGDLRVIAGDQISTTGFRLVIEMPVAEAPFPQPNITREILPSPSATLLPTETVAPTATSQLIPYSSVVKITARIKYSSYLKDVWTGSGAIVSPEGLILTNAHLVTPGQGFRPDFYEIALTQDPSLPPAVMYYAEPVIVDEDLDLAVLRITTDLKYNPVDTTELNLPTLTLGNSADLTLGDPLIILGYPGIGGDTITLTRGDVGGFTVTDNLLEPAFIKTSAAISGGTSGGVALDQFGRLVAVPTRLGYGQQSGELVDCRVVADTNGDGNVDQRDVCVPVGGFINALRPVNLAKPLIERALNSPIIETGTPTP
jgi:S1-C subfamily serine protease